MSGYLIILGRCWSCSKPFTFNADRELRRRNADRQFPPIEILPGAYEPEEIA